MAVDAVPGSVLFAPRDLPHRYAVGDEESAMLFFFTPDGFEGFVYESSVPAGFVEVPPPELAPPDDLDHFLAAYRAEILA